MVVVTRASRGIGLAFAGWLLVEIAAAVGFLCGAAASYVNGQVLVVDGGFDATGIGLPSLSRRTAG